MGQIGVWENAEPGVKRKIHPPGKALMIMEVEFEGAPNPPSTITRTSRFPIVSGESSNFASKVDPCACAPASR